MSDFSSETLATVDHEELPVSNYYLSTTGNIYKATTPLHASDSQLLYPSEDIDQHLSKSADGVPLPTFHNLVEDRSLQASIAASGSRSVMDEQTETALQQQNFEENKQRLEAAEAAEAAQKKEDEIIAAQAEKEKQDTERAASRSRLAASRLQSSTSRDTTGDTSD